MSDKTAFYCTKCGTELVNGACPKCSQAQQADNAEKFKRFFMNPKEEFVCALGNGYIQNFLANGSVGNGFAVVSNKRVYFNGKIYEVHNSRLKATSESRTVDLKDVTGTGVRAIKYPLLWILAIVAAVLLFVLAFVFSSDEHISKFQKTIWDGVGGFFVIFAVAVLPFYIVSNVTNKKGFKITAAVMCFLDLAFILMFDCMSSVPHAFFLTLVLCGLPTFLLFSYAKTRITLLTISYAGGCIAFDINWYSKEESDGFQKMLRIAKDKAVEDAENATANAMREVMSSVTGTPVQPQVPASTADELMKYAQLYKDGLLSEEEFAAIKAKML